MKISNVIIYGHKSNHTHSHIHSSYFKTFSYLGYNTIWVNSCENINIQENTLFLTEGQVDRNIPLRNDCYYILHHCDLKKYIESNCKYIQLGNYLKFCDIGKNHYYENSPLLRYKDQVYFDIANKLIYQMWGTDLLPHEIDNIEPNLYKKNLDQVYYVGSIWSENEQQLRPFIDSCYDNRKGFVNRVNVSDLENLTCINQSYLSVDIRGDWHKECGYFPCRVFKNISYGKLTGTNSQNVFDVMCGEIPFCEDTGNLFNVTEECYKKISYEKMKGLMTFVKENHTYLNRIDNLLYFFEQFY